jgi:hypothetical protein
MERPQNSPDLHVLELYEQIRSRRVDIVGDYAGTELFLVEGDSLLLDCFSDTHIDFKGATIALF